LSPSMKQRSLMAPVRPLVMVSSHWADSRFHFFTVVSHDPLCASCVVSSRQRATTRAHTHANTRARSAEGEGTSVPVGGCVGGVELEAPNPIPMTGERLHALERARVPQLQRTTHAQRHTTHAEKVSDSRRVRVRVCACALLGCVP
jgi:hypothetical protein